MVAIVIPFHARAARRPVARDLCTLSELAEAAVVAQVRAACAWQRVWIRAWWGL